MTIYDRDYYRREGPSLLGSLALNGQVCRWLIGINVVIFFLQAATRNSEQSLTPLLMLDPAAVLHGEIWRLLTYAFAHDTASVWHIVVNMLFLWWFGNDVEEHYGSREFLIFYLLAAVVGGLAFLGWQVAQGLPYRVVGASGAVTAVMVVYACHHPGRLIYIFGIFPVPIWVFVGFQVLQDSFVFVSGVNTQTAVTAHLGGAAFGFLYYKTQLRLADLVPRFRLPQLRSQTPLRIYRDEAESQPVAVAGPAHEPMDEHLEAEVDAVLEKVTRSGKDSLTEQERAVLLKASEVYKRRRG